ncbi:MAG TPA: hypothetical protein VGZ27_14795 [Vicinamibacterales bacterium]|jgi:hypothetical protein|nr:hypothetical protein [Vicinamibacterales bacterium]
MSRGELFLGVIAVATLLMALVQVGVIVCGVMLARRVARIVTDIEREMMPIMQNLNAMARDAARATALAAGQVERVDKLFTDLTLRVEQTAATVQKAIIAPLREGAAVMAAVKAALAVLKALTRRSGPSGTRSEEEDALFIG